MRKGKEMKLPRSIRHLVAKIFVYAKPEWGGILHDYDNGRWDLIMKWENDEGAEDALDLIENMIEVGRDRILIACIKVGNGRGFFYVVNSEGRFWSRAFWDNLYTASEAFKDISLTVRAVADSMGYRRPPNE
jgi:hypothetical protein